MSKRLVIVGAGFAGITLAINSSQYFDVTIIDRKDFLELSWATVRAVVNPEFAKRVSFNYSSIPNIGKFVQGTAVSVTEKEVLLEDGSKYPYDFLAVSVGTSYSDPAFKSESLTRQGRLKELKALHDKIKAAKNVVVVGGGPTGVEVVAEILDAYAGKNVTLIHSGSQLLDGKAPKVANYAHKWVESHGARVLLNNRVTEGGPGAARVTTSSGETFEADVLLWCVGNRINTGFLKAGLLAKSLDSATGALKVLPTLQVEGYPHIFALGDCNDVPETKLGFLAVKQGELVAKSLRTLSKRVPSAGNGSSGLGKWKPGMGMSVMMVTLGAGDGVGHLNSCVCTGMIPTKMKSKDLFVEQYRRQFKVPNSA